VKTINLYKQLKIRVKCQAHNLKVAGSYPTCANNLFIKKINILMSLGGGIFGKYKIATFIVTFKLTENLLYNVTAPFS